MPSAGVIEARWLAAQRYQLIPLRGEQGLEEGGGKPSGTVVNRERQGEPEQSVQQGFVAQVGWTVQVQKKTVLTARHFCHIRTVLKQQDY